MANIRKVAQAESELLDRRLEPMDLVSERFDGQEGAVRKRLFIFAQPRTASYSFCRFCAAAGWGLPIEYFNADLMQELTTRLLPSAGCKGSREYLERYVLELEHRRSRNGLFSMKVMWDAVSRLRLAYRAPLDARGPVYAVYLRRGDFGSQVISFALQQVTGVYSFTDAHRLTAKPFGEVTEDVVSRVASYLIREEANWFAFFEQSGLRPEVVQTEELLNDPLGTFDRLAVLYNTGLERENLTRYAPIERDGCYLLQKSQKDELLERYGRMLTQYETLKQKQFQMLSSRFESPQDSPARPR